MSRFHYLSALAWLVASILVLQAHAEPSGSAVDSWPDPQPVTNLTGPQAWFSQIRPSCNTLEVELALRRLPPPISLEGSGYAAACLALAGRIDAARGLITALDAGERWKAAGIVFDVGHPIADAGDDRSAGPIMGLVVEFWPNNYMALYHAGMANFAIGEAALARRQLKAFLELYHQKDGWRSNAIEVLGRLEE